jgi:hypothetical protein
MTFVKNWTEIGKFDDVAMETKNHLIIQAPVFTFICYPKFGSNDLNLTFNLPGTEVNDNFKEQKIVFLRN